MKRPAAMIQPKKTIKKEPEEEPTADKEPCNKDSKIWESHKPTAASHLDAHS